MDESLREKARLIEQACGIPCVAVEPGEVPEHHFCARCGRCEPQTMHKYGLYEAQRWGGQFVYFCARGLAFAASSVTDELRWLLGGCIAGPVALGQPEDYDEPDLCDLLARSEVRCIPAEQMNAIAELLTLVALTSSHRTVDWYGMQKDLSSVISRFRGSSVEKDDTYPIELEGHLQQAIAEGDGGRARSVLNRLLNHLYFANRGDLSVIRARTEELMVLLGRAAIAGGAEMATVFELNDAMRETIQSITSFDELNLWVGAMIDRYMGYLFEFNDARHADVIHKTIGYIREHAHEKLTLDELAKAVYLSRSYLSRIFKAETGMNLSNYINRERIRRACSLLVNTDMSISHIAHAMGFDEQSYFTRIFTQTTGVSPSRYRQENKKVSKGSK